MKKLKQNRSSRPEMFSKKGVLKNLAKFTGKHLFLRPATLFKKVTLAQVFSCEFCKISKNNFFHRTPPVATSGRNSHPNRNSHPEMFYKKVVPKMFAKLTGKYLCRSFFFVFFSLSVAASFYGNYAFVVFPTWKKNLQLPFSERLFERTE